MFGAFLTLVGGAFSFVIGAWLRMSAHHLAKPRGNYFESGDWSRNEAAYQDLSRFFLLLGIALIIVGVVRLLWRPVQSGPSPHRGEDR